MLARISFTNLEPEIINVRWGPIVSSDGTAYGTIMFDFKGILCRIAEPRDVILVGFPDANKWIAVNYGFLLSHLPETNKGSLNIDEISDEHDLSD